MPAKPVEDLANLKITDARVGDMVSITGAGDDFGDLDFKVDRHNQYEAGEKRWVELGGMYRERRVYLEVMDGDELEVTAVLNPNKLTIEDLGLNEQDLTDLDQRQNTGDNFEFDGKLFYYRFSKEIAMSRDGQSRGPAITCGSSAKTAASGCSPSAKAKASRLPPASATLVNPGDITDLPRLLEDREGNFHDKTTVASARDCAQRC